MPHLGYMDTETSQAKMLEQVCVAKKSAMARELGWVFESSGLRLYLMLRPRKRKNLSFLLRATFDDFPQRAPSYVFVENGSKEMTGAAWPPDVRHGADPPGICTPGTREFHENYHVNDQQYPWDSLEFYVLGTIKRIHDIMERGVGQ